MRRPVPRVDGVAAYRTGRAAEYGAEGAQATYQQGQNNQQTGAALMSMGEQLDVAAAQEAITQFRAKKQELTYDPEKGYRAIKGGDVLKQGPDGKPLLDGLPATLQAQADELSSKLISPRAKALFQSAASKETETFKRGLLDYMGAQTEAFKAQAYKNAQTGFQNSAAQAETLSEIEGFADQAYKSTLTRAAVLGIDGEEMAKGARSDVLKIALTRRIQLGDDSAIGLFDRWKDKLDAKDLLTIESAIKTMREGVTARGQAQALLDNTYDGRTRAYESGQMEPNRMGSGAFGPYQFMPATWSDLRSKHPDLNLPADMTKATREQHDAAHERFKAGNAASLRAAGLEATPANLYLAHRFGSEGAVAVLRANPNAPLSSVLPAKWQEQNPDMRGQTAGSFRAYAERRYAGVTDIGLKVDPLQASVNRATGVEPPKDGPQYMDTRQMLLDADTAYDAATRRNNEINATNEAQRRATQSQLDLNLAAQKRQIEMAKLNLEIAVDKWMTTGGPGGTSATQRPPPEIWNQLSYQKQQSIDATIAHNAKGSDVVTDQQVWYEIQQGLTSADPATRAQWANKPLWEYKRFLSNSDFQELSKIQSTARAGDPNKELTRILTTNQMVDDTLQTLGVKIGQSATTSDAEKANNFRRLAQQQITAFEVEQKRKATPEEQRKIIDRLAMPTFLKKGTLWGEVTKPAYEVTVGDIPASERDKIVEALKSVGRPVTDDAIVDLYRRNPANARPKK
jgi:hypothetical protein